MSNCRALHFVFKVADRPATINFFRNLLGMQILRHEEFGEGCKASCNGPYDGKWSKTMVGYGPEDTHFVVELAYNYGVGAYKMGNDFKVMSISNCEAYRRITAGAWPIVLTSDNAVQVEAPGGYRFEVRNVKVEGDPVQYVALSSTDLQRSIDYWCNKCGITLLSLNDVEAILAFDQSQCHLKLVKIDESINHASAFGRIAFACARSLLPELEAKMEEAGEKILTKLLKLDTPGKAAVEVVILADPDGHEICFVGDEAFRELSKVDPNADSLLTEAIVADRSVEWFKKRGGKKTS